MLQQSRHTLRALALGLFLLVSSALAQADDAHVAFVTDVEKCKAHLAVSAELYAKGDRAAALHASHPIQEITALIPRRLPAEENTEGGAKRDVGTSRPPS